VLASLPDAPAISATSRFTPAADAYVSQARPDDNFGNTPTLRTDAFPKSDRSYLRFDVAQLAGTVTAARLRLYAETASRSGYTVRTVAGGSWTEDNVTYANAPTPGAVVATSGPVARESWTSVDVTALVHGNGVIALALSTDGRSAGLYASRETGVTAPQLVVEMVAAPTTSTATTTSGATTTTAGTTTGATTTTTRTTTTGAAPTTTTRTPPPSASPPPPGGYFSLASPGKWSSLPSGATCKGMVNYSTWEPRPDNFKRNHVMPDSAAVRAAFGARPRAAGGAYDPRWDSWLLPRVDGQFTGATDEIFQWAACKWGLPDDLIRGVAYRESQWYQYEAYPSGRCLPDYGCTDLFSSATTNSRVYCGGLATYSYDYQKDFGSGLCPKTFSIVSVMSWQDPAWGPKWPGYQNGTFPFSRESTAFAVDYYGAYLRGCYEGWSYLGTKTAGDIDGCIGSWYSGAWHDTAGDAYDRRVRDAMSTRPWLTTTFASQKPACSATYGCPGPDRL
jgi:hypothetical protein